MYHSSRRYGGKNRKREDAAGDAKTTPADIIAVDANPLENVRELESVDFVMKGGVVYVGEGAD